MHSSPPWLVGLVIVFAVLSAALFGLFIYRHAEAANLEAQHTALVKNLPLLRVQSATTAERVPKLDELLKVKREKDATLDELEKTYLSDIDRLVRENRLRLSENDELFKKELKTYNEQIKEMPEKRAELAREEERMYVQERDFDESRRKLRDDVEKSSRDLEQLKKKGRSETITLDRRVAELDTRVKFLTNQVQTSNRDLKSDGSLVDARTAADGFVIIDRGSRHRLKRHTQFDVYTMRAGKYVVKGRIEVLDIEPTISVCRVLLERDGNDPLIAGDQIHNPVYDPNKVTSFAVRGDFRRFSTGELSRFIEESGAKLDPDLSINTDFLVAGASAQADVDRAVKLGVSILSEDQLLDFVRPDPSRRQVEVFTAIADRARSGASFALAGTFAPVSRGEVSDTLKNLGARITGDTDRADCVVVGDDALPAITAARARNALIFDQSAFAHIRDQRDRQTATPAAKSAPAKPAR